MSLYGTEGCYEENAGSKVWTGLSMDDYQDVTLHLTCTPLTAHDTTLHEALQQDFFEGYAPVHPTQRLPEIYHSLDNGHSASHQFLVDDFLRAIMHNQLPPCHVWAAARWCAPGLVAHESALNDGLQLPVPDFGEPRSDLSILNWKTGK